MSVTVPHVPPQTNAPHFPPVPSLVPPRFFGCMVASLSSFHYSPIILLFPCSSHQAPRHFLSVPSLRPSATTACGLVVWIGCWWLPWSLRRTRACGVAQWSAPRQRQSLQFRVLSLSHALGLSEFAFGGSVSQIFGLTEVCFLCISLLFGLNGSTQ